MNLQEALRYSRYATTDFIEQNGTSSTYIVDREDKVNLPVSMLISNRWMPVNETQPILKSKMIDFLKKHTNITDNAIKEILIELGFKSENI